MYFQGVDILYRQSCGNGRIPEVSTYLILRFLLNRVENLMHTKYSCFTVAFTAAHEGARAFGIVSLMTLSV